MSDDLGPARDDDARTLRSLGYEQELSRGLGAFSNFALSLSIICILAGGITSFHIGLCSVGGAAIGLGWPLVCLFSLTVAATMGQVASAFPTAGGLYHWASILGGRGWGWATAWFNLVGLVTVLAAINVGTWLFVNGCLITLFGFNVKSLGEPWPTVCQHVAVALITFSQAVFNHRGIRLTAKLTDFSGYLILIVSVVLTVALVVATRSFDFGRLVTFDNFSGYGPDPKNPVWPRTDNIAWLFLLGFLLPAYTLTGFDASAHASEETVGAAREVPRGIVRSVLVSGVFGWVMLCAVVLAAPSLEYAAGQGEGAFYWITKERLSRPLLAVLYLGIVVAQYLCGLAALTSTSRMTYAFARDRGLPFSQTLRSVNPVFRTPVAAIWTVAALAWGFTLYTPVYSTITVVCAVFLYISYVLPAALGFWAYGRTWTRMGPWNLGRWYRPLAVLCVLGCGVLLVIGVQPPNDKALWIVVGAVVLLAATWFAFERRRFPGPPHAVLRDESSSAEARIHDEVKL